MKIDPPKTIFKPAPAGTHLATCVKLIDLGLQDNTFKGETKTQHQAMLTWELPGKLTQAGRPFLVSKTMNLSLHEKATFRSWAENMMGRTFTKSDIYGASRFDAKHLLGQACLLKIEHVEHEGRVSAKVTNCISVPDGMSAAPQVTENVYFSLHPDEFVETEFAALSSWTKEKIEKSETYIDLRAAQRRKEEATKMTLAEIINDECPF